MKNAPRFSSSEHLFRRGLLAAIEIRFIVKQIVIVSYITDGHSFNNLVIIFYNSPGDLKYAPSHSTLFHPVSQLFFIYSA